MATLAVIPHSSTLFEVEDRLMALVDSAETILPEQEAEYLQELQLALETAVEKRDRVHQFLVHLETQAILAAQEMDRLKERKRWFESARDRMEAYVVRIIEGLGTDAKGKYRKLEGRAVTLSIRACPASVDILNDQEIPITCKTAEIRMPAARWESLLDSLDLEARAQLLDAAKVNYDISRTLIKQAFDAKEKVPGADLKIGQHSLVCK